jgi:hypothetical protein
MMQQLFTGRIRLVKSEETRTESIAKAGESKTHSWAFNEAVVIATLAMRFGSDEFPLGRKRYTKLSYLLHRHAEQKTDGYRKKAAGPYNPLTRYGGPERIAVENGYVREHARGPYRGFLAAEKVDQAERYFTKWYGRDSLTWLDQFRFKSNDDLELLTTVDMAAEELRNSGTTVNVGNLKGVLRSNPEWKAKLERAIFSDAKIASAAVLCLKLFDSSGK